MTGGRSGWCFLEGKVINKGNATIRCHALCATCFECAHFEASVIDLLDPCDRGVMDEAPGAVEVVDGRLHVYSSFIALKAIVAEVNKFALNIGCVQTKSHTSALRNKC